MAALFVENGCHLEIMTSNR